MFYRFSEAFTRRVLKDKCLKLTMLGKVRGRIALRISHFAMLIGGQPYALMLMDCLMKQIIASGKMALAEEQAETLKAYTSMLEGK